MKQHLSIGAAENSDRMFDEIIQFLTGRYINSSEAAWRILGFSIHEHYPAVYQLQIHLENGQRVYFDPENSDRVLRNPKRSTLIAFFELSQIDNFAKTLLYSQVPQYYTFNQSTKKFCRRTGCGASWSLPSRYKRSSVYCSSKLFRVLFLAYVVPGPESFVYLKTVNGEVCATYQEACLRSGLKLSKKHPLGYVTYLP